MYLLILNMTSETYSIFEMGGEPTKVVECSKENRLTVQRFNMEWVSSEN